MLRFKVLFVLALLSSSLAGAHEPAATSNDFADVKVGKTLTREQILDNFTLTGEYFVVSTDGTRILRKGFESRIWKFSPTGLIYSNWSYGGHYSGKNIFSIKHVWELKDSGQIEVTIEQYE